MNVTKRDIVFIIIIVCLAIGWLGAVINQQVATSRVTGLYNKLVGECNRIIGVQDLKDFCINLPDGTKQCNQQDLNLFQSSFG